MPEWTPIPRRDRLIIKMDIPKENILGYDVGSRLVITNNPPSYDIDDYIMAYYAFVRSRKTIASIYPNLACIEIETEVHSDPRESAIDWSTGVVPWTNAPEFTNIHIYIGTKPLPGDFPYFQILPSYTVDIGRFVEEKAHDYWPIPCQDIPDLTTYLIHRPLSIDSDGKAKRSAFSDTDSILAEDSKKSVRSLQRIKKMISSIFH
jgi:hypothetical protein